MKRITALALGLLIIGFPGILPSHETTAQQSTILFDGTTLKGWNMVGDANWELVDGVVQATNGMGGYLVTSGVVRRLSPDAGVRVTDDANSGVFIRCSDPKPHSHEFL